MTDTTPAADGAFTHIRAFDAPRDLVWRCYTEREHLMHWWGPKGFKMLAADIDLRPGGVFHYGMQAPDGSTMWGRWILREVAAPERLVNVISFSDEAGGVTRHPLAPQWPLEMLSRMTLTERDGRTTLALMVTPENATEAERAVFEAGREGMRQGFSGTFDQLEAHLAQVTEAKSK